MGDNQAQTDLVYVSTSTANEISIDWDGKLTDDEIISRKAELTLEKIYDMEYSSRSRDWTFKIDVSDDNNMPNNAVVWVVVKVFETTTDTPITSYTTKYCSFNNHVLSCSEGGGTSYDRNYLLRLQTQQVRTWKGTVIWKNERQLFHDIPFIYTFNSFNKAYGKFFTDKWHFMISAKYGEIAPLDAKVIVDILHNDVETTATCTLLQKNSGANGKLHCISDYATQKYTDTIKINTRKNLGTVTWSGGLTSQNNLVSEFSSVSEETQIKIINIFKAGDMYFADNKWFFSIIARTDSNTKLEEKRYNVDLLVLKYGKGDFESATAYCFLYKTIANINLRFVCYCGYENQNKEDFIKLNFKSPDGSPSIKWINLPSSDPKITLNTNLIFMSISSAFTITLKPDSDTILPKESKVLIDFLDTTTTIWYTATCISNSDKTSLSCTKDTDIKNDIVLTYAKSLDSSVTWRNKNEEDYSLLTSSGENVYPITISTNDPGTPDAMNLELVKAYNLIYGSDSKWTFDINYAIWYATPSPSENFKTSILYGGVLSVASCTLDSSHLLLHCAIDKNGQQKNDLIQVNNGHSDATITWRNLDTAYDITINATLNYIDSYSFTCGSSESTFKVKIGENDILPENGILTLDLIYSNTKNIVADCTHKSYYLDCSINQKLEPGIFVHKVSKNKIYGSISWNSLSEDKNIPIASKVTTFNKGRAKDLELIQGQWKYKMQIASIEQKIYHHDELITINSKIIKKDGTPLVYLTKCYVLDNGGSNYNYYDYECTVIGDNQEQSDLVSITNSNNNDISISWNGKLQSDEIIVRKATLSLVKVYDLIYSSGWNFKIEVKDDENMPENGIVWVTVRSLDITNVSPVIHDYYKVCSFNQHVLSCSKGSDVSTQSYLLRAVTQKIGSSIGSVTWKNERQLFYDIPLNYTFNSFNKAYGKFFTDKIHFMINAKLGEAAPLDAKVIVDILHNDVETTATCTLLQKNSGLNGGIHCVSDYATQASSDIIKIRPTKKYGSIVFNSGITEDYTVTEHESVSTSTDISIINALLEANDMYFADNKWFFNMFARTASNTNLEEKKYNVDIAVIRAGTTNEESATAYCFLYKTIANINLRFVCYCNYNNQNKEDLIKLSPGGGSSSIKWKNYITSNYPIILNTALTYQKFDELERVNNKWNFKVTLINDENVLLPLGSKVVIDVLYDSITWYYANCTADSKTMLSCISSYIGSRQDLLSLTNTKSLTSSVTWNNENKQDDSTESPTTSSQESPSTSSQESPTTSASQISSGSSQPQHPEKENDNNAENSSNFIGYIIKYYLLFSLLLI